MTNTTPSDLICIIVDAMYDLPKDCTHVDDALELIGMRGSVLNEGACLAIADEIRRRAERRGDGVPLVRIGAKFGPDDEDDHISVLTYGTHAELSPLFDQLVELHPIGTEEKLFEYRSRRTAAQLLKAARRAYDSYPGPCFTWSYNEYCSRWEHTAEKLRQAISADANHCPYVAETCREVARMLFDDVIAIKEHHRQRGCTVRQFNNHRT